MEEGAAPFFHSSNYFEAAPPSIKRTPHRHALVFVCTLSFLAVVAWQVLPAVPAVTSFHVTTFTSPPWMLRSSMTAPGVRPRTPLQLAASAPFPIDVAASFAPQLSPLQSTSDSSPEVDANDALPAEVLTMLAFLTAPFLWVWRTLCRVGDSIEGTYASTTPTKDAPLWRVLWDFSRPHTLIGSALCIPAVISFAAPSLHAAISPLAVGSWFAAFLPSLFINIYVTGLNQITDLEIDKVNKPYLPIASGALSLRSAIAVVSVCLVAGLAMVPLVYSHVAALQLFATPGLQATLVGSAVLGTLYSLPPFRLKRFPLLAATCILAVRGLLVNVGFYAHGLAAAFGGYNGPLWHLPVDDLRCAAAALFFVVFGVIIALMKDVPDLSGDRTANIRTFTVRLGPKTMFCFASTLLVLLFSGMAGALAGTAVLAAVANLRSVALLRGAIAAVMVAISSHVSMKADKVDAEDPKAVYKFYMFLWRLFYLAYLTLPFLR
eukprot:GGOE01020803.1.p1 GENE.GGOE01020803.1~~GGOE01020803.1.p1  ORF type:complete len:506 (+),score=119.90 GGOE01020803.1:47-1519(+)